MTIRAYPDYVDSGVPWLGSIPSHWDSLPLKRIARLRTERAVATDFQVALENINSGGLGRFVETESEFGTDGVGFSAGDVLFGKLRPYLAKVWVASRDGEAVGDFHVLGPVPGCNSRFLFYQLAGDQVIDVISGSTYGAKMPRASWDFMGQLALARPPLPEQEGIAIFLDRETGKIDALVAEQERLIALLKEKRQALISHAVTKGLDPNVPMKDSGVAWLGHIPSTWDVIPLMWLTQPERPIMYGIVLPGPDVGEGVPILKGGNVRPSRLNLQSMARTTVEIERPYARARLRCGDLVYSIRGSIGDCEVVPRELEGSNITQDVARIAPRDGINRDWLRYVLLSSAIREDLSSGSLGAAVRGINIFDLKRVRIPTPTPDECEAIAAYLAGHLSAVDDLSTHAEAAIDLLLERRSALISAAVTGKIDVRGLA